jgi:hypothetical protein
MDTLTAADEEAAAEELSSSRCTDGLPIVVPTPERVERMLAYGVGVERDMVIGKLAPAGGLLTVEKAAINAVMAGCRPELFPLVIAACEAIADPLFDLGPIQTCTHSVTPFIVVNGPARAQYAVQSGIGALGPGFRANATLGRAIRFIMINVGGGVPGVGDMAALGSPAKFTCCMGEDEEASPFEPLHVSRGYPSAQSTVTVLGVEGPHSLFFDFDEVRDGGAELFLRLCGAAMASPGSNNIYLAKGMVALILQPLHARILAAAGLDRLAIQRKLYEYATTSRARLRLIAGAAVDLAHADPVMRVVQRPEDFLILVGGAEGAAYSAFMPSFGGGVNGQVAVTKQVRVPEEYCENPLSSRLAN